MSVEFTIKSRALKFSIEINIVPRMIDVGNRKYQPTFRYSTSCLLIIGILDFLLVPNLHGDQLLSPLEKHSI